MNLSSVNKCILISIGEPVNDDSRVFRAHLPDEMLFSRSSNAEANVQNGSIIVDAKDEHVIAIRRQQCCQCVDESVVGHRIQERVDVGIFDSDGNAIQEHLFRDENRSKPACCARFVGAI